MKYTPINFTCKGCGAPTRFSPDTGLLSCEFCNASTEIKSDISQVQTHDLDGALSQLDINTPKEVTKEINCPKCGGGFTFAPHASSTLCPNCQTPTITKFVNNIVPESIIPFEITHKKAKEIFSDWIGSIWFAPSELKHLVDSDKKMTGNYLPYWCYNANTLTTYRGERGDIYYVTIQKREVVDGKEQTVSMEEERIEWSDASGTVSRGFDDVTISASTTLSENILRAISPWNTDKLKPFDKKFLAGFESQEHTIRVDSGFNTAKKIMSRVIEDDIVEDIGGDKQSINSTNTIYMDKKFKNSLFPIWTTHFSYKGKEYVYAINGENGKVTGERPYSYTKIAILLGAIVLAITAAIYYYR